MAKKSISIDEGSIRTLDFLIEEYYKNKDSNWWQKAKMPELRNKFITNYIDKAYQEYHEKYDKDNS